MRSEIVPTIRISETSWERLKAWAEPLEDSADSALAKALDAAERDRRQTSSLQEPEVVPAAQSRRRRGRQMPWRELREPLLQAIYELGGSAPRKEAFSAVRPHIKDRLLPRDLELGRRGNEIWQNTAKHVRRQLVESGHLRDDSPRGIWALSEKGTRAVESRLKDPSRTLADHLRAMPDAGEDSDFDRSPS